MQICLWDYNDSRLHPAAGILGKQAPSSFYSLSTDQQETSDISVDTLLPNSNCTLQLVTFVKLPVFINLFTFSWFYSHSYCPLFFRFSNAKGFFSKILPCLCNVNLCTSRAVAIAFTHNLSAPALSKSEQLQGSPATETSFHSLIAMH